MVTDTYFPAQPAEVTFGQQVCLAKENSSAQKTDTIRVATATDSPAQLAGSTITQPAHLADEDLGSS